MRKFDRNDPITWIFQMEQFFDLHQVPTLQMEAIKSLYLELDQFLWCQWLCGCKRDSVFSWTIFTYELTAHYGDVNRNTLFS